MNRECAFDLWDWTAPCRNISMFYEWVHDLHQLGFNVVEISAPWNLLEPQPGKYDLSFIEQRLEAVKRLGMELRVRINSYYAGATPSWLRCDYWCNYTGQVATRIPSVLDNHFWQRFAPLCTAIACRFQREPVQFSPFIGVQGELKWSDWWTYDPSALAMWRRSIASPRPAWLRRVVGDAPLPEHPPLPPPTRGTPDLIAAHRAFIAFREQSWRNAVTMFVKAVRSGNPKARISVPLGEGYRRASAQMSNTDYYGLSRDADHIVHSYDFFWHTGQSPWYAAASVAAFQGITGLPVSFEIDGPILQEKLGYSDAQLLHITRAALAEGAYLKIANYSYSSQLPSRHPLIREAVKLAIEASPIRQSSPKHTVLLFVSKWTNYCYREETEWLHDAQFGAWHMLTQHGYAIRFICEDNLTENLQAYRGIYIAFSPLETMPKEDQKRLKDWTARLPSIVEVLEVPSVRHSSAPMASTPFGGVPVTHNELPVLPEDLSPKCVGWKYAASWQQAHLAAYRNRHVVLGFPLAFLWLKERRHPNLFRFCDWLLRRAFR